MAVLAAFGVDVERAEFSLRHHRTRLIDIHVARGSVESFRRECKQMIRALWTAHALPRVGAEETGRAAELILKTWFFSSPHRLPRIDWKVLAEEATEDEPPPKQPVENQDDKDQHHHTACPTGPSPSGGSHRSDRSVQFGAKRPRSRDAQPAGSVERVVRTCSKRVEGAREATISARAEPRGRKPPAARSSSRKKTSSSRRRSPRRRNAAENAVRAAARSVSQDRSNSGGRKPRSPSPGDHGRYEHASSHVKADMREKARRSRSARRPSGASSAAQSPAGGSVVQPPAPGTMDSLPVSAAAQSSAPEVTVAPDGNSLSLPPAGVLPRPIIPNHGPGGYGPSRTMKPASFHTFDTQRDSWPPLDPAEIIREQTQPAFVLPGGEFATEFRFHSEHTVREDKLWQFWRDACARSGVFVDLVYWNTPHRGLINAEGFQGGPASPAVCTRSGPSINWSITKATGRVRVEGKPHQSGVIIQMLRYGFQPLLDASSSRKSAQPCSSPAIPMDQMRQAWAEQRKDLILMLPPLRMYEGMGRGGIWDLLNVTVGCKNAPFDNARPWVILTRPRVTVKIYASGKVVLQIAHAATSGADQVEAVLTQQAGAAWFDKEVFIQKTRLTATLSHMAYRVRPHRASKLVRRRFFAKRGFSLRSKLRGARGG